MSKGILAGFAGFAIIVGGIGIYLILSAPKESSDVMGAEQNSDVYTLAEVAKHSSKEDCWTVINGKVYELNSFILNHPGGDVILDACGGDATKLFNSKGGQGSHSAAAMAILQRLQIGEIAE